MLKYLLNYEGLYSIDEDSNVYSHPKGGNVNLNGKWLKQHIDIKGYKVITLTKNGVRKTHKVHRLMVEANIRQMNKGEQVNHINGIKTDNRIENLEITDSYGNIRHAYATGLVKKSIKHEKDKIFGLLSYGNSQRQVARMLNISQSTVSRIVNGKSRRYSR
jgi:hypothetical protein